MWSVRRRRETADTASGPERTELGREHQVRQRPRVHGQPTAPQAGPEKEPRACIAPRPAPVEAGSRQRRRQGWAVDRTNGPVHPRQLQVRTRRLRGVSIHPRVVLVAIPGQVLGGQVHAALVRTAPAPARAAADGGPPPHNSRARLSTDAARAQAPAEGRYPHSHREHVLAVCAAVDLWQERKKSSGWPPWPCCGDDKGRGEGGCLPPG